MLNLPVMWLSVMRLCHLTQGYCFDTLPSALQITE